LNNLIDAHLPASQDTFVLFLSWEIESWSHERKRFSGFYQLL